MDRRSALSQATTGDEGKCERIGLQGRSVEAASFCIPYIKETRDIVISMRVWRVAEPWKRLGSDPFWHDECKSIKSL